MSEQLQWPPLIREGNGPWWHAVSGSPILVAVLSLSHAVPAMPTSSATSRRSDASNFSKRSARAGVLGQERFAERAGRLPFLGLGAAGDAAYRACQIAVSTCPK